MFILLSRARSVLRVLRALVAIGRIASYVCLRKRSCTHSSLLSTSCPHFLDKRSELLDAERSHPLRDEARKLPLYLRRVDPNR